MAQLPGDNCSFQRLASFQLFQHNMGGLRVSVKVELGHWGRVSDGLHAPAHDVDVANVGHEVLVQFWTESNVREWAQEDQVNVALNE